MIVRVLDAIEPQFVGDHGGAWISREGAKLVLSSSGEDACESLAYLSGEVADAVEVIDPTAVLNWVQHPPVPTDGGPPTVHIDGYWIPDKHVAVYRHRRDRALARVAEATNDVCDEVRIAKEDGIAYMRGTRNGDDIFALAVGSDQLDMMDECTTRELIRQYALGNPDLSGVVVVCSDVCPNRCDECGPGLVTRC